MSEQPVPPGIPPEDWANTPASVRTLVLTLLASNAALQQQVSVLQEQVIALQQQVADLQEKVNRTSQNSSKPPSADPPSAPARPKRSPSKRRAGGQPGHRGHGRVHKAETEVDQVVPLKPVSCGACGALLLGEDPAPVRHQVTELPRVEPVVTEYQQHTLTCLACGAQTAGAWPQAMPRGRFGPRLQATIGYLAGRIGASQRDVAEVLETVFHTEIGLGSIPAQQERVSAALAEPVAEAHTYVKQQAAVNADETSWHERTKRAWLWIARTPLVTIFLLLKTRSADGAHRLLGETFAGIVGSDRWWSYNWLDPKQRQLCWAHLKRDFQALVDRGGESARIGRLLLKCVERLFTLWHRVRDGTLSRAQFQTAVKPIQTRVHTLLREGTKVPHAKTQRTCANILKLETALWTFVRVEGVEPTNNDAERPLRRAVLWRRRSFGTQSETGSRFVERVLTAVTTLRQQRRDVLDYLTEACAAAIRGDKAPSLLPNGATAAIRAAG
jgi:transposase